MPDVKIKGYSGNELEYPNVPKVYLAAPESTADNPVLVPFTYGEAIDGVEVEPDFSAGDMQITAPDGYLIRSGVVKKPETLVPENIRKNETVAGIKGEYEGTVPETEEKIISADFSGGDMVVTPTDGAMFSKVTIQKPETLVPENIPEGMYIAGIGPGLFQGNNPQYSSIEIFQTVLTLSIPSTSEQKTRVLLAADELPSWWPAAGDMVAHAYGSSNPIYSVYLVRQSGSSGSKYLYSACINNFTGYSANNARSGYINATSNNSNGFSSISSAYWNYATPSSYSGLYQNDAGIGLGSYNGYCACKGTYKLILLKLDPFT